ncbi:MAG: hypothetical protein ACI8RZ_005228 [Myxococcota bacterium]|jgi:hypothetical protein
MSYCRLREDSERFAFESRRYRLKRLGRRLRMCSLCLDRHGMSTRSRTWKNQWRRKHQWCHKAAGSCHC